MKVSEASIPAAGGFFGGLLCGVGIGVALMYILDPDKGIERRSMIKDRASAWGNDGLAWGGKTFEGLRDKAQGIVGKASDTATSSSSIPTSFNSPHLQ